VSLSVDRPPLYKAVEEEMREGYRGRWSRGQGDLARQESVDGRRKELGDEMAQDRQARPKSRARW
jgi:hypothetical protein